MTKDLTRKTYDMMVQNLTRALEHGEKMVPSLISVMDERKKQLDICLASFNEANVDLNLVKSQYGVESIEVYKCYKSTEPYLTTLTAALKEYSLAFNDVFALANANGALREKLELFLANEKTPEMVVGTGGSSLDGLLDALKPKKDFGGN